MTEFIPWAIGLLVVVVVGGVLWTTFRRHGRATGEDVYLQALEAWLAGDLDSAATLLHRVVHDNPDGIDPFLQLGNLLRLRGDPRRAAMLHRSLTVRPNLPRTKRLAIGLALAEDLIDLQRWDEANQVLDGLARGGTETSRYWRARFAARHGEGNLPEAARALKRARTQAPAKDRDGFQRAYAAFQLDRALQHALDGEGQAARSRLKDVEDIPGAQVRAAFIRAMLAAAEGNSDTAVALATEDLLDHPRELALLLPVLQDLLLQQGQFSRTIPLLERASQSENAPASLWIALALLYEKIGEREKALRLLESKARRRELTPDVAAPYLRQLAAEARGTDFGRVWNQLHMPQSSRQWICRTCGRQARRIHWFCPACRDFDSYAEAIAPVQEQAVARS